MHTTTASINLFRKVLHQAFKHWVPISLLLSITGTGFSILFLYIYSSAIGRPDIFLAALNTKSSLVVWLLGVIFLILAYLFILTVTTLLYGLAVSMFSGAHLRRKAAAWLLLPLTSGFLTLIVLAFFFHDRLSPPQAIIIMTLPILAVISILARSETFRGMVRISSQNKGKRFEYGFLLQLTLLLLMALFSSIFPVSLILNTYVGEDTQEALRFIVPFSLGTLILSLAPTYVFFILPGGIYKRMTLAGATLTVLFFMFMLIAQGAASSISYAVAGKLEIRQHVAAHFVLGDHIQLGDLDSLQWKTRQDSHNRVMIEAYQLFAIGDVLLLCPGSLLNASLHRLPQFTSFCLLVRRDEVHRKPPRSRYPAQDREKSNWQKDANQFISWSDLRKLIYLEKE